MKILVRKWAKKYILLFRRYKNIDWYETLISLSVWAKIDKQNENICAVMKKIISTIRYNQGTNFLQFLFFFVIWFSGSRSSCSVKIILVLRKSTYSEVGPFAPKSLTNANFLRKFFQLFFPLEYTISGNTKVYCLKY